MISLTDRDGGRVLLVTHQQAIDHLQLAVNSNDLDALSRVLNLARRSNLRLKIHASLLEVVDYADELLRANFVRLDGGGIGRNIELSLNPLGKYRK